MALAWRRGTAPPELARLDGERTARAAPCLTGVPLCYPTAPCERRKQGVTTNKEKLAAAGIGGRQWRQSQVFDKTHPRLLAFSSGRWSSPSLGGPSARQQMNMFSALAAGLPKLFLREGANVNSSFVWGQCRDESPHRPDSAGHLIIAMLLLLAMSKSDFPIRLFCITLESGR